MPTQITRGMSAYLGMLRQFSPNARLLLLASFLTGFAFGAFRLLSNFYVLSLGYNESFLGTLQTAQSLAAIMIVIPVAWLVGKFAHRRLLLILAFIAPLMLVGLVMFPFQAPLIGFRMGFGMLVAARQVVVAPFLMANTHADERQWVFSFELGSMMTAMFVGNTIGGMLPSLWGGVVGAGPTDTISYQLAIATLAGVATLATLPLIFIKPRPVEPVTPEVPWRLLRVHGWTLLPYFIPNLLVGLGAGLMQPFMNVYFRTVYAQPDPIIGIVFALGGISMAIAQFAAPPLADARGKINTVIMTQALSIPFLLLLGIGAFVVPSGIGNATLWFIIAAIAYNFRLGLMNMGNPVYQTFMLERAPEDARALTISLSSIAFQFGWFVMPQISGDLQVRYGAYGFVPIFFTVAFFYFSAIMVQIFFFKRRHIGESTPVGAD